MRAWAMSRATIIDPDSENRVLIGYLPSWVRIAAIGWFRSMLTTSPASCAGSISGRKRAGFCSSCSRNTPSAVILPLA